MSRRSIRHGGVLVCDMPKCQVTFTTYSMISLTRSQALGAGWARRKGKKVLGPDGMALHEEGARKVDLCPEHSKASEPPKKTKEEKKADKKKQAAEEKAAQKAAKKEKGIARARATRERNKAKKKVESDEFDSGPLTPGVP